MTQLPRGWALACIDDLVSADGLFCDGDWVESKDQSPGGEVRLTQLADVGEGKWRDRSDRHLTRDAAERLRCTFLEAGDVLVARMPDPLGRACLFPGDPKPSVTVVDVAVIRPGPAGIRSDWLMWAINAPGTREQIEAAQSGTTRKRISRRHLGSVKLGVPPLPEQGRIVTAVEEAFSLLDAGEAGLRTARTRLKRMRDSVLVAAVTGQLVPQDPTDTPAAHELATLGVESAGVQSLQELPASWMWVRLGSIASEVRNGVFASRPSADPPGIPILRIGAVRPMSLDLGDVRYADLDAGDPAVGRALLEGGDLLFTRYNGNPEFVGACAAVPSSIRRVLHPDKLIRVKVDAAIALPRFVEIAASAGASRTFTRSVTKTTAGQAGISGRDLKRMPLPLPPVAEQVRIVTEVERQFSFIEAAERAVTAALTRSRGLRRSVLKAAFEGRLVPQDPSDEPASVLLERVAAERAAAPRSARRGRTKVVEAS